MRFSRPVLALVAAASLTAVAACGSAGTPSGGTTSGNATGNPTGNATGQAAPTQTPVTPVTGESTALAGLTATGAVDLKTAPKVDVGKVPVSSTEVEKKVLTPGTGTAATQKDVVGVRAQIFNGTSGKLLDDGFTAKRPVESFRLSRPDLVQGFIKGLVGSQKGSRIAFTIPPKDAFGEQGNPQLGVTGKDTIVVVADVADVRTPLTQVDGTQTASPAGLPTVEFKDGPTKAPTVTVPTTAAPTKTEQATLIEGTGATVTAGQTITAQYHGVLWRDGSVFDSSWQRGTAADFPIGVGQVIPGWDKTLVGKKVGSRVLLVIPAADGYGTKGTPDGKIKADDTLVFVVDILDAS